MTKHWVQIYSNQKEIKYISQSNIRASVETRLPGYTIYSNSLPPSIPGILCPPPRVLRVSAFTRISSPKRCNEIEGVVLNRACVKGFFVLNWVRFQTSATDLYPNVGRVTPPPPERSRDCGMPIHRRQRNNNWTRQKNSESFVFAVGKVISLFPVLNTPENLTDFL